MAALIGDNQTEIAAGNKAGVGDGNGHIKQMFEVYTPVANVITLADTIFCGTVPKGARIVGGALNVEDQGTVGGFSLGTVADPDGIVTALTCTTAAGDRKTADGILVNGDKMTADTDIYMTCTATTDASLGKKIRASVFFVKD
jgi:hypothetical protein